MLFIETDEEHDWHCSFAICIKNKKLFVKLYMDEEYVGILAVGKDRHFFYARKDKWEEFPLYSFPDYTEWEWVGVALQDNKPAGDIEISYDYEELLNTLPQ